MKPLTLLSLETLLTAVATVGSFRMKNYGLVFTVGVLWGALFGLWSHYRVARRMVFMSKEEFLRIIEFGYEKAQIVSQLRDALEKNEDAWALDCARRLVGLQEKVGDL
jgi:hypothetical protein